VDICCARFGVPLYGQARAAYPLVRAWRMTHFGGHRYAPTAWDFPSGYKWAHLDADATRQVLTRSGSPASLRGHVRGWSALPAALQVLEREGLALHGWDWLDYRRAGRILDGDDVRREWRVQLDFAGPGSLSGAYTATVSVARDLPLIGCGVMFDEGQGTLPEYRLDEFRLIDFR
jgi:hypothetical protein